MTDLETIFELLAKEKTTLEILACWGIEIELNNFANNIWSSSLKISQIQIYPKCVENDICDTKLYQMSENDPNTEIFKVFSVFGQTKCHGLLVTH